MPNYNLPSSSLYITTIGMCDASFTFVADYVSGMNVTFANVAVTTACGGGAEFRCPMHVHVSGNALTDPNAYDQLEVKVNAYMAGLEA